MTKAVRLKNVAAINPEVLPETTSPDVEFNYIDIGSVGRGKLVAEPSVMSFAEAPTRARRLVRDGDTIISTVRTYLGAVLPIQQPSSHTVVSTGFAVVRPSPDLHPPYLGWVMQSESLVDEVVARSGGVSYPAIAPYALADVPIPVPDRQTQIRIADFLDRETARIDALMEKKRRLIDLLEDKRTALITHAVTKGLDPTVPMKESGVLWFPRVPQHWEILPLRYLCDIRPSNVDKKEKENEQLVTLCNYTDVYYGSYILDSAGFMTATASPEQLSRFRLRKGDVLITKDSETPEDIAVPAFIAADLVNTLCGYHLALLRPRPRVSGEYLYWSLESQAVKKHFELSARGVTRYGLTRQALGDAPIPVPPPGEQEVVSGYLRSLDRTMATIRVSVRRQLDLLDEYRRALITAAVLGDVDPDNDYPHTRQLAP